MIRLGSLAGYPFEGPRLLAGWTPPATPAVYAIAYKPDPETRPERYAVIYVGHSDDLTAERFPFKHPRSPCWVQRAGSRWKVYICTYEVPGGGRAHREQIARELTAIYRPRCNTQQYDQAWKDHWIGEYSAPTTGPLASRGPDDPPAGEPVPRALGAGQVLGIGQGGALDHPYAPFHALSDDIYGTYQSRRRLLVSAATSAQLNAYLGRYAR